MSRLTKPGLSHPPSIGGIGMCIDQIDAGAILIGNGVDFDLNTLTAGAGLSIVNSAGNITLSATGTYDLPIASGSVLGGIKVGSGLAIDGGGVLSVINLVEDITFVINGGGATIDTGIVGDLRIPYACNITSVEVVADQSTSTVIDIWKSSYSGFPPLVGNSITASAKPNLSSALKSQDSTLTGWTTGIAAGDYLRFKLDSNTAGQLITISLTVQRTS